jgi:hypothetical protein
MSVLLIIKKRWGGVEELSPNFRITLLSTTICSTCSMMTLETTLSVAAECWINRDFRELFANQESRGPSRTVWKGPWAHSMIEGISLWIIRPLQSDFLPVQTTSFVWLLRQMYYELFHGEISSTNSCPWPNYVSQLYKLYSREYI